ncbi:hypothetical protein Ocin01_05319 [Orchesella cincta]|uniref:Uncharacterized protein n=1 Tax=Orchesella cincta TaxID=48709 RepID=A0A1D2N7Y1_ORCCI|nr:hypothetical protein Ocin01_05319 [Orchesella cincta]
MSLRERARERQRAVERQRSVEREKSLEREPESSYRRFVTKRTLARPAAKPPVEPPGPIVVPRENTFKYNCDSVRQTCNAGTVNNFNFFSFCFGAPGDYNVKMELTRIEQDPNATRVDRMEISGTSSTSTYKSGSSSSDSTSKP